MAIEYTRRSRPRETLRVSSAFQNPPRHRVELSYQFRIPHLARRHDRPVERAVGERAGFPRSRGSRRARGRPGGSPSRRCRASPSSPRRRRPARARRASNRNPSPWRSAHRRSPPRARAWPRSPRSCLSPRRRGFDSDGIPHRSRIAAPPCRRRFRRPGRRRPPPSPPRRPACAIPLRSDARTAHARRSRFRRSSSRA